MAVPGVAAAPDVAGAPGGPPVGAAYAADRGGPAPAAGLTALFDDPAGQHGQICLALQQLVERVARGVVFPSSQCREELTRDVYVYCLKRLGRYDPAGRNAEQWFTVAARRQFWRRVRLERRHRAVHHSLAQIDHDSARLRPIPRLSPHRTAEVLVKGPARDRLAGYLDDLLQRVVTRHGKAADPAEGQLTRGMFLALQEVRRRITGSYRRVRESDLAYSERFRMEEGGGMTNEE